MGYPMIKKTFKDDARGHEKRKRGALPELVVVT